MGDITNNTPRNTANLSPVNTSKLQPNSTSKAQGKHEVKDKARKTKRSIPFADIAKQPLFQAIADAICPTDLTQEFAKFGLRNVGEAAIYNDKPANKMSIAVKAMSSEAIKSELTSSDSIESDNNAPKIPHSLKTQAQREAKRAYRMMQHTLALKDPMNLGLRHTPSHLTDTLETAYQNAGSQTYADPTSLQSSQSTAAYLRHLYRIATGIDTDIGIIQPESGPNRLQERRPDLDRLTLSETNLKQEVPVIDIINEVLDAGLGDMDISRAFYPIALPFDDAAAMSRTALTQMSDHGLNGVYTQTRQTTFPLTPEFRLAGDVAGLLGLSGASDSAPGNGSVMSLLSEDPNNITALTPSTLEDLYGTADIYEASSVNRLQTSLDLEFDGLAQLLGLYVVELETGVTADQQDYATSFLQNTTEFKLVDVGTAGMQVWRDAGPITAPELRSLHYLTRLHHSTGIGFHHLNLLLSIPGAAAAIDNNLEKSTSNNRDTNNLNIGKVAQRHVTATGLRVLANFLLYKERYKATYDLSPEAYVALFDHICPYWRADEIVATNTTTMAGLEQTEVSFMRELFGDDAPWLYFTITVAKTPITNEKLASVISRGLGISSVELNALTAELEEFSLMQAVDARGLSALYRLATLFRMLDWPILSGIALLSSLPAFAQKSAAEYSLWDTLTTYNKTEQQTDKLCTAFNSLMGLAQWMDESALSPDTLLAILTPTNIKTVRASDADRQWFDSLAIAIEPITVSQRTFSEFERWYGEAKQDEIITADTWYTALLDNGGLYNHSGIFNPDSQRELIDAACRAYLRETTNIDLNDERNSEQLEALVTRLERTRNEQIQTTERQLATLAPNLSVAGVTPLIYWAQTQPLMLLQTLCVGAEDANALFWLYEIRRYASADAAIDIGDIGLWLIAHAPQWLHPNAAHTESTLAAVKPLDLEQLYYLQHFAQLQLGTATDAAWRGYLMLSNDIELNTPEREDNSVHSPRSNTAEPEQAQEPLHTAQQTAALQALAILLECSVEDAQVYSDHLFGTGEVANTVAKVDLFSRHVRLANELKMGAQELLALKAVCDSTTSGDWNAAKTAAELGLYRFSNGAKIEPFQHAISEQKRDALVAAYMQTKIATDSILAERVIDRDTLYSYLLLDVSVTSAVPTSRLVEAMSSLQTYITRALNGAEDGVRFIDRTALATQWRIDKNYRLWEANQKLALYPQNYIEPDLRYNTSPEFDTLLQAVSGNELNETTAESAVNRYMAGLANACALSVCSIYVEQLPDPLPPANANYHLLARADWEQGRFFYRKLEADFKTIAELQNSTDYLKALDWTFWQEVNIPTTYTLFSDVALCVFQNRYFFFWLEIEERRSQTTSQGSNQEETLWRIHPRYMRCDADALTGPMYTPGLFFGGTADDNSNSWQVGSSEVTIDNAFEWSGTKPSISTTYHPMTVDEACEYGTVDAKNKASVDASSPLKSAIYVTFGINLKQKDGSNHQSSLQLRLTEEWADAIFFPTQPVDTRLQKSAPDAFVCVHPQPSTALMMGEQTTFNDKDFFLTNYWYHLDGITPGTEFFEQWSGEKPQATFKPSSANSNSIGTIEAYFEKDFRAHYIRTNPGNQTDSSGRFTHVKVDKMTEISMQTILSVSDNTLTKTIKGAKATEKNQLWYGSDIDNIKFSKPAIREYPSNHEYRKSSVAIPADWIPELGSIRKISVKINMEQTIGQYGLDWYSATTGKTDTLYFFENFTTTSEEVDVGSFSLQLGFAKTNTAWAAANAHGSRNFLHLIDNGQATIDTTLLLMNSSSAMSKLAQSMPRPGDFRGLFTLDNQMLAEDLGTFPQDFTTTLRNIYPDDTTTLNPERMPKPVFDFDGAYGVYGWEVFYHIPATLAASYANSGQFDEALSWLEKIFDPKLNTPWQVYPMAHSKAPHNGSAFDTGDIIVDPDRIAMDYPFYYQQTIIRQYLETLLAAGDTAFEEQTQETLQQAKSIYLSAKQLFSDQLPASLNALSNQSWENPTLEKVASDGYSGFLPPYNQELRRLYNTLNARLSNLRQWLDIEGNPLNIPLLAAPIDPRKLQQAAKAGLTIGALDFAEENKQEALMDFMTVARSVKQYIANMKTTSSRLQSAAEKADDTQIAQALRTGNTSKLNRELAFQNLGIEVAEKDIQIKIANIAAVSGKIRHDIQINLYQYRNLAHSLATGAVDRAKTIGVNTKGAFLNVKSSIESKFPTIFGVASGGAALTAAAPVAALNGIGQLLGATLTGLNNEFCRKLKSDTKEKISEIAELSATLASASMTLEQAKIQLEKEKQRRNNLNQEILQAEKIADMGRTAFGNSEFYRWLKADLEQLLADEWSVTIEFCRLLATLFEDETGQTNGQSFIKTTSLGSENERFNAPYRLALDIERLEMAYVRSVSDQQSQCSQLTFSLNEIAALNGQQSIIEALTDHGEAYFELTDDMFEALYPGQYDRNILSVSVHFPGLAKARLSPHGRLTQISNTRYHSRERDITRGGKIRKNRYALQSIMLDAPTVDTANFDYAEGLLKRFQNTGVESRWRLVLPSIYELKNQQSATKSGNNTRKNTRNKAWRKAASQHLDKLKPHLDDIEFTVTFSGRW